MGAMRKALVAVARGKRATARKYKVIDVTRKAVRHACEARRSAGNSGRPRNRAAVGRTMRDATAYRAQPMKRGE